MNAGWLATLTLLLAGATGPTGDSAPSNAVLTTEQADALLAYPPGSLSLGSTGNGSLREPVRVALRGTGWRFLPRVKTRATNHGTAEMAGVIERLGAAVSAAYEGVNVRLGNISIRDGGKTPWHASHQAGRDIDILFLARDGRGRPADLREFVSFDADGRCTVPRSKLTFDDKRNLTVVRALLEDPEARVQWIFVADWLKERLVAEAREQALPEELLTKMEAVLRQPSDSMPHANHFHVRTYCSIQDRLHGCLDWGPRHPWVNLGDVEFSARVGELAGLLDMPDPLYRRKGLDAIASMYAVEGIPNVLVALGDDDASVRTRALSVLRRLRDPMALPGLLGELKRTQDLAWAEDVFSTLGQIPDPVVMVSARAFLEDPSRFLHPAVLAQDISEIRATATELLGKHGRAEVVPTLLSLLDVEASPVREAAHSALRRVTNQHIDGPIGSSREGKRKRVTAAWEAFWKAHAADDWLTWMRLGFEARGVKFPSGLRTTLAVERLIETIGHREAEVSDNAVRVLGIITGHVIAPRSRVPVRQRRHFRHWWTKNEAQVTLAWSEDRWPEPESQ